MTAAMIPHATIPAANNSIAAIAAIAATPTPPTIPAVPPAYDAAQGRVFPHNFALAVGLQLSRPVQEGGTANFVVGAATDGQQARIIHASALTAFLDAHWADNPQPPQMAVHGAVPILAALHHTGQRDVYALVEQGVAWDTQLLFRLLLLGTEGDTGEPDIGLLDCVDNLLNPRRAPRRPSPPSFGRWLGQPTSVIPDGALRHLVDQAQMTLALMNHLWEHHRELLHRAEQACGYGGPQWLEEARHRWGPQTHHIQLRAACALADTSAHGLRVDLARRDEAQVRLHEQQEGVLRELLAADIDPRLPGRHAHALLAKPVADALHSFDSLDSFKETLARAATDQLHAGYDVLTTTGRTSSPGEFPIQCIPKDDLVRSCIVPSPGNVFIGADFAAIDLVALARVLESQFQVPSEMAFAIRNGHDLHRLVAAQVTGKAPAEVTSEERNAAKPVSFGLPAGMGAREVQRLAQKDYGITLSKQQANQLIDGWHRAFPEMRRFHWATDHRVERVAEFFELRHGDYLQLTNRQPNPWDHVELPSRDLGWWLINTLAYDEPWDGNRQPIPYDAVYRLWQKATLKMGQLPSEIRNAIRERQSSPELKQAVLDHVDRCGVITWTGRLRANAACTQRRSTLYQGLSADGAKMALWCLWRAGYRVVAFIHDEFLVEVPANENLRAHAGRIAALMVAGMQAVVGPDLPVGVKVWAADRWYAHADAVWTPDGQLALWRPTTGSPSIGRRR